MGVMNISQITNINSESYFIDTNIWINCFFYPVKQPIEKTINKSREYLNFFEKTLNNGGKYLPPLCVIANYLVLLKNSIGKCLKQN